jgi:hypothetical protein
MTYPVLRKRLWEPPTGQFTALLSLGSLLPLLWVQHDTNLPPNQLGPAQHGPNVYQSARSIGAHRVQCVNPQATTDVGEVLAPSIPPPTRLYLLSQHSCPLFLFSVVAYRNRYFI